MYEFCRNIVVYTVSAVIFLTVYSFVLHVLSEAIVKIVNWFHDHFGKAA